MIKSLNTLLLLAPLVLLGSSTLLAQDLNLFEAVASDAPVNPEAPSLREQRVMPTAPAFTLVGTSRIGGRHKATLASSSGEVVVVEFAPGENPGIPDHPGYRLVDMESRRVSIAHPGNMPCVPAQDRGVRCAANGNSELTMATAAPVAPSAAPLTAIGAAQRYGDANAAGGVPPDVPDNPFAAALRAAAMEAAANGNGGAPVQMPIDAQTIQGIRAAERFQPRRIPPDQVPQGMRVVRTPFGDQIVEQ